MSYREWTTAQLDIQPYQHLLEIGYGSGRLLEEVAHLLRIGFLAGIESSLSLYQQAYRRNRRFIRQQLLQLHIGELFELSYPSHYFHTIYGSNIHLSWKDPETELIRLSSLLRSRGRLVLLVRSRQDRQDPQVQGMTGRLCSDYAAAGLTDIQVRYQDLPFGTALAVTGSKA